MHSSYDAFLCDTLLTQNPKVTADRLFNMYGTNFENCPEPIYGNVFLPRKFKIAVTVPGDNSVDVFTNDIGVVVISDKDGTVTGYNLLVGGGMGRALRNDATYPRLADPLGYVDKEDIFHAIKAIVAVQRDYGRRDDRKQARLKYLVAEWGFTSFAWSCSSTLARRCSRFSSCLRGRCTSTWAGLSRAMASLPMASTCRCVC